MAADELSQAANWRHGGMPNTWETWIFSEHIVVRETHLCFTECMVDPGTHGCLETHGCSGIARWLMEYTVIWGAYSCVWNTWLFME